MELVRMAISAINPGNLFFDNRTVVSLDEEIREIEEKIKAEEQTIRDLKRKIRINGGILPDDDLNSRFG